MIFQNDAIHRLIINSFTNGKDEKTKERIIRVVSDDNYAHNSFWPSYNDIMPDKLRVFLKFRNTKIEGRLKFLEELEPDLNTPLLQERLKEARHRLQDQLKADEQ